MDPKVTKRGNERRIIYAISEDNFDHCPSGNLENDGKLSRNIKAILAVLGSSAAIFWPGALTFGFPGVMVPIWQEMFHVGRAATGFTIFFMLAAVGIFMFLVGRWQERYGIRRMIMLGVILTACSSVIIANATSIYMVYAWAFLNGLASCFIYIPALTLVQLWYPEKKGLASGIVSMVFGLSAAIMSPLFGRMLIVHGILFHEPRNRPSHYVHRSCGSLFCPGTRR